MWPFKKKPEPEPEVDHEAEARRAETKRQMEALQHKCRKKPILLTVEETEKYSDHAMDALRYNYLIDHGKTLDERQPVGDAFDWDDYYDKIKERIAKRDEVKHGQKQSIRPDTSGRLQGEQIPNEFQTKRGDYSSPVGQDIQGRENR